jgi:hypothetical protein
MRATQGKWTAENAGGSLVRAHVPSSSIVRPRRSATTQIAEKSKWFLNPQYLLTMKSKGTVTIELSHRAKVRAVCWRCCDTCACVGDSRSLVILHVQIRRALQGSTSSALVLACVYIAGISHTSRVCRCCSRRPRISCGSASSRSRCQTCAYTAHSN